MSTDKTLADVQPGGRVRLGDGLRPCPFCGHSDFDQWPCEYIDASGANVVRCARCHAAAPMKVWHDLSAQPSPGGQDADMQALAASIDEVAHRLSTYMPHLSEWADRARDCKKATEVLSALAARQPVGEPVGTVHSGEYASGMPWCEVEWHIPQPAGTKLYTAPTARAVDLDAMRALLQRRIEQWRSHLPADPGAPGTREIETKGEHDYNNDVRIYREGIAVMEEVLSKIDSQAVGNG